MPRSYFDGFDPNNEYEYASILPRLPLKEALVCSVVLARTEQDRLVQQADFCIYQEGLQDEKRQRELEAELEILRKVLEDGEQGFYPGKIIALAGVARQMGWK